MSKQTSKTISLGLGATAAVVSLYFGWKFVGHKRRTWRRSRLYNEVWKRQTYDSSESKTVLVNTAEQLLDLESEIFDRAQAFRLLSVDFEWVRKSDTVISLVQISFPDGYCVLIHWAVICNDLNNKIPAFLTEIFQDAKVVKVGVGILEEDVTRLRDAWKILPRGLVDLRHLVRKHDRHLYKLGVENLTRVYLNSVTLDKDWRIRASDWNSEKLSQRQIAYAANDALTVMAVLMSVTLKLIPIESCPDSYETLVKTSRWHCLPFVDKAFGKIKIPKHNKNGTKISNANVKTRDKSSSHSTLSRPLYDNARLEAPDGQLLCVCDSKKALWYVDKALGEKVEVPGENLSVRLKFEPAGRPKGVAGDYYMVPKLNKCVVCGQDENCLRKYIVPHEYRRHFPEVMRDHQSHDVLLMCLACHQNSNGFDLILRQKLAEDSGVPYDKLNSKTTEDFETKKVKSAGRALLKDMRDNRIPNDRKDELLKVVKDHFELDQEAIVTAAVLEEAANLETKINNEDFVSHGEIVVKHFSMNPGGLLKLEKMWREHFLTTMQPQHMPPNWSVDHQEDRLTSRAEEDRITEKDLSLARGESKESETVVELNGH